MKYLQFFSLYDLATLNNWLEQTGELFVDIYQPHSGGGSLDYLVSSVAELKQLIQNQTSAEIEITILREKQFSLVGIADHEFLETALNLVKDGEWYEIISQKKDFPSPINCLGSGDNHSELREDFSKLWGQEIRFGHIPLEIYDDKWFKENRSDYFRLTVTKNVIYQKEITENLEKYKWLEDLWKEN
ncbi:MAG: hypothetical protein MUC29_10060 [Pyrinomonadaceae bacterium]|jgi:hypothetical protein|nr:hypothetical protein [Pyrinomonadaceae bacterium]